MGNRIRSNPPKGIGLEKIQRYLNFGMPWTKLVELALEGLSPHQIAYLDKLGWRKIKPSQKQGIRLNVYVLLILTQAFRSEGIFGCLPSRLLQKDCSLFYSPSACLRVYYIIIKARYVTRSRIPNACRCAQTSDPSRVGPRW